jgi:hypothetical protein
MHSWVLRIQSHSQDLFVYPAPGKVRTVYYQLLYHGFTVATLEDYYSLFTQHPQQQIMTWFLLKYGDQYHIQLSSFVQPVR